MSPLTRLTTIDRANSDGRVPGFLVRPEPRFPGWREAFRTLWLPEPLEDTGSPARLSRNLVETRAHLPKRALLTSTLLHFSIALFLLRVPILFFGGERHPGTRRTYAPVIYYNLETLQFLKSLPSIQSPGPGGKPGQGHRPNRPPALGSTAFHPTLTIVSVPRRPDNPRQTILRNSSPPDLRIAEEVRLPTVLVGNPLAVPKPRFELHLKAPRSAPVKQEPRAEAPVLKSYAGPSDFPLTLAPPVSDSPHLPVPPPSALLASARASSSGRNTASAGGEEQAGDPAEAGGLRVDSSGIARLVVVPPGNRYGAFSISPFGGQPGSPGGVPGGEVGGGTGGAGTGGDGSTGVGPGRSGGSAGGSGAGGELGIAGGNGTDIGIGGSTGTLAYSPPTSAIIPVIIPPQLRKNTLLVFTGPIGGGGLGVYEALRGGKIYTKFLPMPGKTWILQYCTAEKPASKSAPGSRNAVVQLDQGLVPPDPLEQFDFERVPVPEEKADKLIVLHGVIRADGTLGELKLYRGVEPYMDQAALAAFGRWKFRPALRANQPVAVEILVGIPARVPKS